MIQEELKIVNKHGLHARPAAQFVKIAGRFNSDIRVIKDGLEVNVLYSVDDPKKRAVGFKLSEGMEVPKELEGKFKFARQKSKLAGTIRGSFFVIKGEY